uniref:Ig-like domain-containing protein n=1 Tax=Macrostomum lignano TaxID=282301 RepID=A0A1I8HBX4_9PLAT
MQVRMVGEPARLYCQLEGSGVDQIRWLYNSKPIEPRPGLLFVGDGTDSGSHLSIAKLGKHHTGLYTCSVSNKAGIAESAGSVYVRDATETGE